MQRRTEALQRRVAIRRGRLASFRDALPGGRITCEARPHGLSAESFEALENLIAQSRRAAVGARLVQELARPVAIRRTAFAGARVDRRTQLLRNQRQPQSCSE